MVIHNPGDIYTLREADEPEITSFLLACSRGDTPYFFETAQHNLWTVKPVLFFARLAVYEPHAYDGDTLTDFAKVKPETLTALEAKLLFEYPSIDSKSMQCIATLATGGDLIVILPPGFAAKYTFEKTH